MKSDGSTLSLQAIDEASEGGCVGDWLEGAAEDRSDQLGEGGCAGGFHAGCRGNCYGVEDDSAVGADVAAGLVAQSVEAAGVVATYK